MCELCGVNNVKYIVVGFYTPPNAVKMFNANFTNVINAIVRGGTKSIVVFGDLNLTWHPLCDVFLNKNLTQINNLASTL